MERSRPIAIATLVTLLLGAGLVVAGTFLPWTKGGDFSPSYAIVDFEFPKIFFLSGVAPLAAAVVAVALGLLSLTRQERLVSGLLIGFGAMTLLLFLAYLGVSVFGPEEAYSFGIGSLAGVAGGALILLGGLATLGSAEAAEFALEQPAAAAEARQAPSAPEAGWYSDPAGAARLRYWSGERWTEQTQ